MPNIFLKTSALLFFFCFYQAEDSFAQHKKDWAELGDKAFNQNDFYGASIYYDNARFKDPTNLALIAKLAESLRLNSDYKKAEDYYKYVALKDVENNYPLARFWQALMEEYNAKYSTSLNTWGIVKTQFEQDTNSYEYQKAVQAIKSCNFAMRYPKNYQPIEVTNMGNTINTTEAEFGTWLQDDSVLYFSSLRGEMNEDQELETKENYFIKIHKATYKKGNWVSDGVLDSIINNPNYHTGNGSLSSDKKRFYFSRCDLNLTCKLYQTSHSEFGWKPAQILTELNEKNATNTQPMVSNIDGVEVMFFVSNRPGGYGKNDIWYTIKQNDSTFTPPINVGPEINSPGDEITPFYDGFDSTLYFSSDWHVGFGGFDVFKVKLDLNNPMVVENMGPPINTSVNDFYFSVFKEKGFLTSNRAGSLGEKGLTCCNDLYQINFVDRKKEMFLTHNNNGLHHINKKKEALSEIEKLNKLLPLSLYFNNDYPNPKTTLDTTEFYYDSLLVDYKTQKELFIKKSGKGFRGDNKDAVREEITQFFEIKVEESELKLASFLALLRELLMDGKKLNLVIRGYASPLADSEYNLLLTKRRIVSFTNMLLRINNGEFEPYMNRTAANGGELILKSLPFGELMSLQTISDNVNDKSSSVFSAEASLERKIDIVAITTINQTALEPFLKMDDLVKDFGEVTSGDLVDMSFSFTNTGNAPLVIKAVDVSCGCTVPELEKNIFQPGERGVLKAQFDSSHKTGRQFKTITIHTNGKTETIKLSIVGLVNKP